MQTYYTDAEVVNKDFATLEDCLSYIQTELIEKKELVDRIIIDIE